MVKGLDRGFEMSEFKFQSHGYILFWTNTLRKGKYIPLSHQL